MKKTRTSPFRPQSDGMVERFNRTLAAMLAKMVDLSQDNWDECLPYAMLAYRSSVHSATGFSPASVLLGLNLRLPLDLLAPPQEKADEMYGKFVNQQYKQSQAVRDRVGYNLREVGQKMKDRFDNGVNQPRLEVGDHVWVMDTSRVKGLTQKLRSRWKGPFEVLTVVNDQLVRLREGRRRVIVHRSRLKKDSTLPLRHGEIEGSRPDQ